MNGAAQRTHRTAVEQLEARIKNLETCFAELAAHYSQFNPAVVAHLTTLSDASTVATARAASDASRSLSARLRWLLTGR